MYAFIVLVLKFECVKCFNINTCTHLQYLCFFDCQVDFDVDNVQRHELVNGDSDIYIYVYI